MHLRNNSERKNCKTFPNFYRVTNWRCRSCDVTKKCRLEKLSILSMLRERKGTIVYNSLVTVSNRSWFLLDWIVWLRIDGFGSTDSLLAMDIACQAVPTHSPGSVTFDRAIAKLLVCNKRRSLTEHYCQRFRHFPFAFCRPFAAAATVTRPIGLCRLRWRRRPEVNFCTRRPPRPPWRHVVTWLRHCGRRRDTESGSVMVWRKGDGGEMWNFRQWRIWWVITDW